MNAFRLSLRSAALGLHFSKFVFKDFLLEDQKLVQQASGKGDELSRILINLF